MRRAEEAKWRKSPVDDKDVSESLQEVQIKDKTRSHTRWEVIKAYLKIVFWAVVTTILILTLKPAVQIWWVTLINLFSKKFYKNR